jgi:hypothetical protein
MMKNPVTTVLAWAVGVGAAAGQLLTWWQGEAYTAGDIWQMGVTLAAAIGLYKARDPGR